jgi:hypothetical protein
MCVAVTPFISLNTENLGLLKDLNLGSNIYSVELNRGYTSETDVFSCNFLL